MSEKPYIICYMMTSVDGRIDCKMTTKLPGVDEYYPLLKEMKFHSVVSGKITAELELAEKGKFVPTSSALAQKEIVSKKAENTNGYEIIVDSKGTLLWKNSKEYAKPHLIMTSEQVSIDYLSYLDKQGISYIVAGKEKVDLKRACEILKETFGIDCLGVVGGSAINTAFLDAGLLDEVIVLIGAGIDARNNYPTVFSRNNQGESEVIPLKLVDVKTFDSGAVLIRYKTIHK